MAQDQESPNSNQNQDWNKDRFPTSAAPVFRGLGLLFALIIGLCFMVYFSSDRAEEEERQSIEKKEAIEDQYLAEDQF